MTTIKRVADEELAVYADQPGNVLKAEGQELTARLAAEVLALRGDRPGLSEAEAANLRERCALEVEKELLMCKRSGATTERHLRWAAKGIRNLPLRLSRGEGPPDLRKVEPPDPDRSTDASRSEVDVVGNLDFALTQAGPDGTLRFSAQVGRQLIAEIGRLRAIEVKAGEGPTEAPADASLEARAKGAWQAAYDAATDALPTWDLGAWIAAVRAVDASRPAARFAFVDDAMRALAFAICAVQGKDAAQSAQLQAVALAHDALRYALGDPNPDPVAENASRPAPTRAEVADALDALAADPAIEWRDPSVLRHAAAIARGVALPVEESLRARAKRLAMALDTRALRGNIPTDVSAPKEPLRLNPELCHSDRARSTDALMSAAVAPIGAPSTRERITGLVTAAENAAAIQEAAAAPFEVPAHDERETWIAGIVEAAFVVDYETPSGGMSDAKTRLSAWIEQGIERGYVDADRGAYVRADLPEIQSTATDAAIDEAVVKSKGHEVAAREEVFGVVTETLGKVHAFLAPYSNVTDPTKHNERAHQEDTTCQGCVAAALFDEVVFAEGEAKRWESATKTVAVAKTDPLAGLPEEERTRIEQAAIDAWYAAYQAVPGVGTSTMRQIANEAHGATVAREVAAYHARRPHVIRNGKADRPGSGLFGRLIGEELQAAHAARFVAPDCGLATDAADAVAATFPCGSNAPQPVEPTVPGDETYRAESSATPDLLATTQRDATERITDKELTDIERVLAAPRDACTIGDLLRWGRALVAEVRALRGDLKTEYEARGGDVRRLNAEIRALQTDSLRRQSPRDVDALRAPVHGEYERARENLRIAIERIATEEDEDPAYELFESVQDVLPRDLLDACAGMLDKHRERVNALRAAFVAWRAVDASQPTLTREHVADALDELAKEPAIEWREPSILLRAAAIVRGVALPVDASPNGGRPAGPTATDSLEGAAMGGNPGFTEVPGVVFDVLGKLRSFVAPFANARHNEAAHLAETSCRACHAEAMLAEIEGAEAECHLAEKRRRPKLTDEQAQTMAVDVCRLWAPDCGGLHRDVRHALLRAARSEQGTTRVYDLRERAAYIAKTCSGGDHTISKRDLIAQRIRELPLRTVRRETDPASVPTMSDERAARPGAFLADAFLAGNVAPPAASSRPAACHCYASTPGLSDTAKSWHAKTCPERVRQASTGEAAAAEMRHDPIGLGEPFPSSNKGQQ